MERKKFLECRSKIIGILAENTDSRAEASNICASALDEFAAGDGYRSAVVVIPAVSTPQHSLLDEMERIAAFFG